MFICFPRPLLSYSIFCHCSAIFNKYFLHFPIKKVSSCSFSFPYILAQFSFQSNNYLVLIICIAILTQLPLTLLWTFLLSQSPISWCGIPTRTWISWQHMKWTSTKVKQSLIYYMTLELQPKWTIFYFFPASFPLFVKGSRSVFYLTLD